MDGCFVACSFTILPCQLVMTYALPALASKLLRATSQRITSDLEFSAFYLLGELTNRDVQSFFFSFSWPGGLSSVWDMMDGNGCMLWWVAIYSYQIRCP